ncbi:MAG: hypothetical protein LBD29_05140 [Treponema sp.]|jgi:hypothetical protein|nr:hypothetical protein [Treponema sp.]
MDSETKKILNLNCGCALLLKDRSGLLEAYREIRLNCGTIIVSAEMNAKLLTAGAKINTGDLRVQEIKGPILLLDPGAVIDGKADYKDRFIIAKGDVIVRAEGTKSLGEAEGLMVLGTLFYPESEDTGWLVKVSGNKQAYPENAQVFLGNYTLENLIVGVKHGSKHLWVSGKITALDKKALAAAGSEGFTLSCQSLLTYEGLHNAYKDIFQCLDLTIVPDGYEITGNSTGLELPLYGPKVYVDGNFSMNETDISAFDELESIIVKGKAELPASAVKVFRSKGKAGEYHIFDGRHITINGFEQLSHRQFMEYAQKGEKLILTINGCLLVDDDVSPEDIAWISSVTYNGIILISSSAKAGLAPKIKEGNGFMGDQAVFEQLTGKTLQDLVKEMSPYQEDNVDSINTGIYMLI